MAFTFHDWTFNASQILALSPVRRASITVQGVRIEREGYSFSLFTVAEKPFGFDYPTMAEAETARRDLLNAWLGDAVA
jgi:hypothetical protein